MMGDGAQRNTTSAHVDVASDPDELARREAENGLRQAELALEVIRTHARDRERPFKLRSSLLLQLHEVAMKRVHPLAGTFRNSPVKIGGSQH